MVDGPGPREGLGVLVVGGEVLTDGIFELPRAVMGAALDLFASQDGEGLDLVDPRGAGRREVKVEAWTLGEPALDPSGLVRLLPPSSLVARALCAGASLLPHT